MESRKCIWLLVAAAVMLTGCTDQDEIVGSGEPVNVELAYAFSFPSSSALTRQAAEVITSGETRPRLPNYLRFIPLVNDDPGKAIMRWEETVGKNNPRSRFYRYRYCDLPVGTNGFLIYGNVEDLTPPAGVYTKLYNGSLIENIPTVIDDVSDVQEGISFSLDPIYKSTDYTDGIPVGAQALADCLTTIAKAGGFNESTDDAIKAHFNRFTNNGDHLPGSAANVRKWIETFRESIASSLSSSELLTAVDAEATTQLATIASLTYPRDINLPDGAAVLRWTDVKEGEVTVKKFVPQISTTTIENINSIARFAYPAPLYYYAASAIKASEEKVDFQTIYNDAGTTVWSQVLANTKFNKTSVSANTKAVVLVQPVQYAVAQLKVKIKAYASPLKDAENQDVYVNSTQFPLKGILVCDQRPVDYRFVPKEVEEGTVSDADVLFVYDNQVKPDCYLTTQPEDTWAEGCNTLVLQSLKDEDVNIILEFEYVEKEGALPFKCVDGYVYPGTRFYMIGRVEASTYNSPDPNVQDENKGQVFTKDYITTVNMTVNSLARAYNVPPNLLSPNLEIGVETTPQWEGATPTVKRLE